MSHQEQSGSSVREMQQKTMQAGQEVFQTAVTFPLKQTVEAQKSLAEMMLNGVEIGNSIQRQGSDLTREAVENFIDALETASQGAEQLGQQVAHNTEQIGQQMAQGTEELAQSGMQSMAQLQPAGGTPQAPQQLAAQGTQPSQQGVQPQPPGGPQSGGLQGQQAQVPPTQGQAQAPPTQGEAQVSPTQGQAQQPQYAGGGAGVEPQPIQSAGGQAPPAQGYEAQQPAPAVQAGGQQALGQPQPAATGEQYGKPEGEEASVPIQDGGRSTTGGGRPTTRGAGRRR